MVGEDLNTFLRDHAHNERKVASAALSLVAHQPHRPKLVHALIELAREELSHFREVLQRLEKADDWIGHDEPDPYMTQLHKFHHLFLVSVPLIGMW